MKKMNKMKFCRVEWISMFFFIFKCLQNIFQCIKKKLHENFIIFRGPKGKGKYFITRFRVQWPFKWIKAKFMSIKIHLCDCETRSKCVALLHPFDINITTLTFDRFELLVITWYHGSFEWTKWKWKYLRFNIHEINEMFVDFKFYWRSWRRQQLFVF